MAQDSGYTGLLTGQLARLMFSIPFMAFGAFHLARANNMAGLVPGWAPGPAIFWVYATGGILVLGGLCMFTGKFTHWAGLALGTMLFIFAVGLHLPKALSVGIMVPSVHMTNFLKDLALAGAAYYIGGRAAY